MSNGSAHTILKTLEQISAANAGIDAVSIEKPHILIVDDIEDNRAILSRRFERQGFRISEADSGTRALEMINTEEYDVVLLDVMMPDMDGFEVLQKVREDKPSSILPVIMVTARAASDDLVHAMGNGADDYITKPVDFAVALARVKTQVARRQAELRVLKAAEAVQSSNDALEHRVRQRTAQLVEVNEQLKKEIVQRERSEAESKYLAYHDALTGLPNRVLFRQALSDAVSQLSYSSEDIAVLFVDLDGFKSVNDTLGHSVGDALLKIIATRLRDLLSDTDTVARLGGDEFAILQHGQAQPAAASALASAIVNAASQVFEIDGQEVTVGASIGITICKDASDEPEELLRNADLAMYRAKSDGRGTFRLFDPQMDAAAQARRQLELDMRKALIHGEFRLFYQPIVNLNSGQAVCFEALLRWFHPVRGLVSPVEFIPVAEETGLIVPLGEWVIRTACMQAAEWPENVRVAVNLSSVQFGRGNIVSSVVSALAASGMAPNRLELEITESVILEKTDQNISILNQLRDLGVRISMDDFGTGYSSLSYLRSFRFDKIKIDQCFVRDTQNDKENRAIIGAIAGLGTCFGMSTTAEGIETAEQLELVTLEGCTEVQGRFFSMPVPANEVETLIADIKRDSAGRDLAVQEKREQNKS